MSLLTRARTAGENSVNRFKEIVNPGNEKLPIKRTDYPHGFVIIAYFNPGDLVSNFDKDNPNNIQLRLLDNMMPHSPFAFGGTQNLEKVYYPGNPEPTIQVLGPMEDNVTIRGDLKAIHFQEERFEGIPKQILDIIENIRAEGFICNFTLGDTWSRWGFIESATFEIERKTRIQYEIDISIIGLKKPTQVKFIQREKQIPDKDVQALLEEMVKIQNARAMLPAPNRSIAERINAATGEVAAAVNILTDYVDNVLSQADNIRRSINRALGIVRFTAGKLKGYITVIAETNPFAFDQPIGTKYSQARFYSARITEASSMMSILARLQLQIAALRQSIPLRRHLVVQGDTLQKISVKYYKTADGWQNIARYNNIAVGSTLSPGTVIEIPRQT